jgi:hypothetical protein
MERMELPRHGELTGLLAASQVPKPKEPVVGGGAGRLYRLPGAHGGCGEDAGTGHVQWR